MRPRRAARQIVRLAFRGILLLGSGAGLVPGVVRAAADLQSAPLTAPSRRAGATMFTALSPERTGVVTENNYADPKMWGERYQEFALGGMGTGVAVADYDNDGRADLFVVSKTDQNRLFRNLGDWRFEDVTAKAGLARAAGALEQGLSWLKSRIGSGDAADDVGIWKQGAAFADVNNDGWLDLYVCRFGAPNLLYVSQGDGTFREEAAARGLAVVDASGMGAFADFDRDGWLDVYLQTNMLNAVAQPGGRRDYLFRNRGDGTFEDVTAPAGISGENLAHSSTWWDFDQDGWPDLYVANDFGPPDRLYRNNRDGTFTDVIHQVVPRMPYSAMGADLGDVNNDGWLDLIVGDMATTTHEKDQRGMASARELSREDSDSRTQAPQALVNTLYVNTGTGRMLEAAHLAGLPATDWTWSLRFEDLDNDGRVDLHVTNGMNREYQNADMRDRILVMENSAERLRIVKASPLLKERNLAYRNVGDLQFEDVSAAWGLDQEGVSFGAGLGDFDGDGDLDVVFGNYEAGATMLRNDSPGGHRVIVALRGTSSNRFGIGATVRLETAAGVQVRPLVVARGYLSSSEPIAHFGLGADTEIRRLIVEWPSGHRQEYSGLAADRRYTITEPAGPAAPRPPPVLPPVQFVDVSEPRALALRAEESFEQEQQPLMPVRFDRRGPALAVGDVDGDGRDDVVLGGTGKQPAQLHLGGSRFALAGTLPPSRVDDGPVLVFDLNGDDRLDVLQTRAGTNRRANSADYQPEVQLGQASGLQLTHGVLPELPISAGAAATADYDRDGRLDVFVGGRVLPGSYPNAPRSALLRNQGGRFDDVTAGVAPGLSEVGMVTSALWSDVDQDGWIDLLLTLEWGGVRYFRNEAGRGFSDRSDTAGFSRAGTGWWTSLASADFNRDGRPDYVAGNVGLNTPYRAPALLYSGRFAAGNATQLVEAHVESGRLFPRATLRTLASRIPAIRRKYPKNDDYARATLGEILGEERLAAAQRYEASELRSGVFLSQPDGTYAFSPLPRVVQIAPVQGMAAGDADGDGLADLYVVHNSFAPIPSIGRFDGGLSQWLRGDGRGGFVAVPPRESGLVVAGDAKALVVLDLDEDGWPDFLVSRNDATTVAWRNAGAAGRSSFRVVLQGPSGNRSGIGARLVLAMADGTRQSAEITCGGGYLSQSAAAAFFGSSEQNPPRRLTVHWPDGRETTHELGSPIAATVRVTAP